MQALNIYEINTITWLHRLTTKYQKAITLANVPEEEWDLLAQYGCNAVWLMGVWQRSPAAIEVNREDAIFTPEMQKVLPDFIFDRDVVGSAYSIKRYVVSDTLGGDDALTIARQQLKKRGMKLLLDFVPNHVAPDHEWVAAHPDFFVCGSDDNYDQYPNNFMKINGRNFALGRDPNSAPWSDVLQLNAFSTTMRRMAIETLKTIAQKCDGVRCDMAMLMTNSIFHYTWQTLVHDAPATEYWHELIGAIRQHKSDFIFIAEAYWDTQDTLLEQGFDYCYNKDFYDAVRDDDIEKMQTLCRQPVMVQERQVRFLENHDEPRIANIVDYKKHTVAAILFATSPSAHMYYDGQFIGVDRKTPVQLGRDPIRIPNEQIQQFYEQYCTQIKHLHCNRETWQLCEITAHGHGIGTVTEAVFSWSWQSGSNHYVVIANYSEYQSEVIIANPWPDCALTTMDMSVLLSNTNQDSEIVPITHGLECRLQPYEAVVVVLRARL